MACGTFWFQSETVYRRYIRASRGGEQESQSLPLSVLPNEAARYTRENINEGKAWGELGHPAGPNIGLANVCILIKELNQDRNDFIGKALVTSTPMGETLKGLIESGGKIGVSTRTLGSLKAGKDGLNEVQADLRLLAVDPPNIVSIVHVALWSQPSYPPAT
jgi:hypothetical protein